MMEELMYFVWQQKLYKSLLTADGLPLEVVHPGLRNVELGPDFFNAKVRFDGVTWAGNVEMHIKSSDWNRHHHQDNRAYDSVILHVVLNHDEQIFLHDGSELKTVVMQVPDNLLRSYYDLCGYPDAASGQAPLLPGQRLPYQGIACASRLPEVPRLIIHDWSNALAVERLIGKMKRIQHLIDDDLKSWDEGFYTLLLRSLGSGTNSDAMERLARSLPYSCLLHHRDNLLQLRALLLGQAGLIDDQSADGKELKMEYEFLRNKFTLRPLESHIWKFSRIRPNASPMVRLEAFARIVNQHPNLLSECCSKLSVEHFCQLFRTPGIGAQTLQIIIINAIIPTLSAYFRWQNQEDECEQLIALLEDLPAESNRFITQWQACGIKAENALESQALLHLAQNYCQPHKCLQCRIGYWLLKHTKQEGK